MSSGAIVDTRAGMRGFSVSSPALATIVALAAPIAEGPIPDPAREPEGEYDQPRKPGWRRFVLIGLGLTACAALVLAAVIFVPRALMIRTVRISGLVTVPEEDIRRILALDTSQTLFSVDPNALQVRLAGDPRLKSASVSLGFPSTLLVRLEERRPVAYCLSMMDGSMRPLLVDATGFVYGWGYGTLPALPFVTVPGLESLSPGTRLPGDLVPTFASLGRIDDPEHSILSAFSEIRIVRLDSGRTELLLYPMHTHIPVRSSPVLELDRMRAVIIALDVLGSGPAGGDVREIDARGSILAYRLKEEQSG